MALMLVVVLLALLSTPRAVRAQHGEPRDTVRHAAPSADSAARARGDTVVRLAPVVVTVLRSPFALGRAPFAVMARDTGDLPHGAAGLALDGVLSGVPGLQVDNRYNYALGERVAIRGFGARAQFGVRGVAVIVDGVPATLPDGQTNLTNIDPAFVGRAEVMRGPASSLYGNAAGGVIQMTSRPSPPQPLVERARTVAGSNGLRRWETETSGRVGSLAYLAGASRLDYGGFRDFSNARTDHANVRVGTEGEHERLQIVANWVRYDAQNPGSLSDSLLHVDRTQAFRTNELQRTGERGHQLQGGVQWERDLPSGAVQLSAWALGRTVENPIPTSIIDLARRAGGVRAVYRRSALAGGEPLRWAVGVEGGWQHDDRQNHDNDAGSRAALTLDQRERVAALAAFAQSDVQLGARTSVVAGVRVDRTRFKARDRLVDASNPDDSGERTMAAVSPSLGVSVQASPGTTVYANVATAFETPTTTELANRPDGAGGFNPDLDPERTTSVEAGAKGVLPGTGVIYQLAIYRARVRDALIPFEVPDAPGRQFFRNAGSAVHQGVELSAETWLFGSIRADAAYTLTDARFDAFTTESGSFGGRRVPGVAPHRVDLALAYDGADPGGFFAEGDLHYRAATPVDDANSAHSAGYALVNVRAGVRMVLGGATVVVPFAGIDNVFDARYDTSVVVNAFGGRFFEPGPGRALSVGVRVEGPVR
ncbi:MAG TPA: TonB-dependent receptor [Gemmatimonadaceae bacterium]|nr:TonB-dependent receptor [Gemmatimonadaceae bacterium]